MSVSRSYCLTLNNYSEAEYAALLATGCRYVILGREIGSEGTPHIQGYIYFSTEKSLSQLKKLNSRAHWEIAKGTPDDNYVYCSKDHAFEERGSIPMSQKRKGETEQERWTKSFELAKTGKLEEIPADIRLRYYRTFKEIKKDYMAPCPDAEDLTGVWIYGAAGCGKSRSARLTYPESYMKMCNKWWDGYQDHETVIIDDLDTKHEVLGHHLKIWGDRYAFLAETKGGAIMIRPKTICVTSQYSIEEIWHDCETRDAMNRRFKVVKM